MNGGGSVGATEDGRHTDDDDIDEEVFAIECVSGIVKRLEVGGDRFDIRELGHVSTRRRKQSSHD